MVSLKNVFHYSPKKRSFYGTVNMLSYFLLRMGFLFFRPIKIE